MSLENVMQVWFKLLSQCINMQRNAKLDRPAASYLQFLAMIGQLQFGRGL